MTKIHIHKKPARFSWYAQRACPGPGAVLGDPINTRLGLVWIATGLVWQAYRAFYLLSHVFFIYFVLPLPPLPGRAVESEVRPLGLQPCSSPLLSDPINHSPDTVRAFQNFIDFLVLIVFLVGLSAVAAAGARMWCHRGHRTDCIAPATRMCHPW